ncbi:NAD dependent epimerase/dehydratase family protein-like protein [Rhizodiscina lignyota]|uniref:NAD dependent epimerase/dehydratase family protein-like protein n=1 Tax=Rhizodiscina lignyota TaxID=1504668 RepID=A0A9P4IR14_9PEZI|nr:NAD dependent epimerase/dehydratase family protein-like protein [Rhizodiscina lignyota]
MAAAVKKKIVVCGGSGFLGSRVCKAAVARNWDVTAVSRSGEPQWQYVTASSTPPSWSKSVQWERADILKPSTYDPFLSGADAVVHSMGILLEADYKRVISGRESPIRGLQRAFSATKMGSQNPLERKEGEDLEPQEKDGQITYELMNRDSAILLARESNAQKVSSFVYISAAGGAPILPARYINTKRAAESTISKSFPDMRSIFIRPGMMYDSSRTITLGLAAATTVGSMFNGLTGGVLSGFMGAGGVKPLKADVVAEAIIEAVGDHTIKGVVEVPKIEALATKAWRRGML